MRIIEGKQLSSRVDSKTAAGLPVASSIVLRSGSILPVREGPIGTFMWDGFAHKCNALSDLICDMTRRGLDRLQGAPELMFAVRGRTKDFVFGHGFQSGLDDEC
jgi:hypothetical protein